MTIIFDITDTLGSLEWKKTLAGWENSVESDIYKELIKKYDDYCQLVVKVKNDFEISKDVVKLISDIYDLQENTFGENSYYQYYLDKPKYIGDIVILKLKIENLCDTGY